ncbi:MAG: hypothetical protein Q8M03_14910 [Legionella sp.]|nr:hypothetical protein [Legionella sp.]
MEQERGIHLSECLGRLERNKAKISHCIIPDKELSSEALYFPETNQISRDLLLERLHAFTSISTELMEQPPKATHFGLFKSKPKTPPTPKWLSLPKEIVSLLYDLYQGNMNDYLQEILNKAEIELTMVDKFPASEDSEKELDIKIKLAATFIDKYSNLLLLIIGRKTKQSQKDTEIIENAYEALDLSTSKLRRINLIRGIHNVEKTLGAYIAECKASCLYWLFGNTKASENLLKILGTLSDEALSEGELIGALFSLQQQMDNIPDANEKRVIKSAINELLISNHLDLEPTNPLIFINEFTNRADLLRIHWYKPFSLIRIDMPLVCS